MVACEVGENRTVEIQPGNAVLVGGVAADFHRGKGAAGVYHASQKPVQFYGVGSGVLGCLGLVDDYVGNGRQQSGF